MKWRSAWAIERKLAAAVASAGGKLRTAWGREPIDLLFAFVSADHADQFNELPGLVRRAVGEVGCLVGCSGSVVTSAGKEFENEPAVSLLAAHLPGAQITPFRASGPEVGALYAQEGGWLQRVGARSSEVSAIVLLAEPFSTDASLLCRGLDEAYPQAVKVGGVASGGEQPGQHALYVGGEVHRDGVVGVALGGNVRVDAVVCQGCRPVGPPLFVTRSHQNILFAVDGRPPIEVLQQIYESLHTDTRKLLSKELLIGLSAPGSAQAHVTGEMVVRNVLGGDADSGALAVGAMVPLHSVVQFFVRDASVAALELEQALSAHAADYNQSAAAGALQFSCVGRGHSFFGDFHRDASALAALAAPDGAAGLFCNGEIGPLQGRTQLHAYSTIFALFRPRRLH